MAYEDFTTYTEFDEGSDVTVDSATKVSWVDLRSRYDTAYLYKDKGVNHFSEDFTHKFESFFVTYYFYVVSSWMVANIIGDFRDIVDNSEDACVFYATHDPTTVLKLRILEAGVGITDVWNGPSNSTLYYVEIVRDDDGGANSTGRYTAYIRTGSHTGTLQDTLVVDCSAGEQNDFRYIYAMATYDDNADNTNTAEGYTQNLDIGEAVDWAGKLNGITNPAKINGVAVANISKVMGIS